MFSKSRYFSTLHTQWMGHRLEHFEVLPSTNVFLKEQADALPFGTMVMAERQTHGYGSKGRVWVSPEGGIYCSLLLPWRPNPLISLAFGVAVAQSLQDLGGQVFLKWPNDLVWNHRKLGGILLEGRSNSWIVAGLGINLFPCDLPDATSLLEAALQADIEPLLAKLLNVFEPLFLDPARDIVKEWEGYACILGKEVCLSMPQGELFGTALGLDDLGGLRILTSTGTQETVYSGTLRLRDGRYA